MRNLIPKLLILLLGLLGASSASAGFYSYMIGVNTANSNAQYEAEQQAKQATQKDKDQGRISCVPQPPQSPDYNLWSCTDAYGNQYTDMVITLKSEIEQLKGGKKLAAGLNGILGPKPQPTPQPPKKP